MIASGIQIVVRHRYIWDLPLHSGGGERERIFDAKTPTKDNLSHASSRACSSSHTASTSWLSSNGVETVGISGDLSSLIPRGPRGGTRHAGRSPLVVRYLLHKTSYLTMLEIPPEKPHAEPQLQSFDVMGESGVCRALSHLSDTGRETRVECLRTKKGKEVLETLPYDLEHVTCTDLVS